jgi:hypothetical protein
MNYLNEFVLIYFNDIMIYNNNKKEHIQHVHNILQRLREANIQTNVDKYDFYTTEIKFLDIIVERDDIKINSKKVKTIVNWDKFTHLKEVQTFLEFFNFYRRFIKNFFIIVKSLVKLIRKNQLFSWSKDCQTIFDELKKRVIETLVSSYFLSELETFL